MTKTKNFVQQTGGGEKQKQKTTAKTKTKTKAKTIIDWLGARDAQQSSSVCVGGPIIQQVINAGDIPGHDTIPHDYSLWSVGPM